MEKIESRSQFGKDIINNARGCFFTGHTVYIVDAAGPRSDNVARRGWRRRSLVAATKQAAVAAVG